MLSAYNVEQAVRYLRQNSVPVQLLITTLLLPGTNGPALIKSAHQIQPDLPVIYLLNNIPKPLQHAAQQYPSIKKPFTIAQLSKTIREALR